jgi:hypothetical protein
VDSPEAGSIIKSIQTQAETGNVDMATAAPGEWDRLVIVQAYQTPERIDRALGFRWEGSAAAAESVASQDGSGVLLFVQGQEVRYSAGFDAGDLYMNCTDGAEFTRDEAVFTALQSDELAPGPALVRSGTAPEPHCRRVFGQ